LLFAFSGAAPLPSSSSVGRAAARRRDLLQASSIESAAVASNVNCTALPGLQACAEPLCFESYELRRNATTGALECRRLPSASALALNLLLPIYDGDYLFLSAGDNALASTSVVDNTNAGRRFTTREGSFRVRAPFAERVRNTGTVFGGWLGRFSQRRASAEVASSWSGGPAHEGETQFSPPPRIALSRARLVRARRDSAPGGGPQVGPALPVARGASYARARDAKRQQTYSRPVARGRAPARAARPMRAPTRGATRDARAPPITDSKRRRTRRLAPLRPRPSLSSTQPPACACACACA